MQQRYESVNAMAARCVDTSSRLREFLFSGREMAWILRRDVATAANLLVALSIELEQSEQGIGYAAKVTAPARTTQAGLKIAHKAAGRVTEETQIGLGIPVS